MDAQLSLSRNVLAYASAVADKNPTKRYVDWQARRTLAVKNPKAQAYAIDPNATFTLFNGTRAIGLDNTTQLQLTASTLSVSRYRFTWTGTGTAPAFRTGRGLATSTHVLTLTANANSTLTLASATANDFLNVQVGDTVFIPDVTTGDPAAPFNPLNVGYWTVLSKTDNQTLQLVRPTGVAFTGYSETVTPASNGQLVAFSAAGVQVGDGVAVSAGFPAAVLNTYHVVAVTDTWFEVTATQQLPVTSTAIPGAAGVTFYTAAKRYVYVEVDQEAVLQLNGDTGNSNRTSPWSPGDPDQAGSYEKAGPCWQLVVVNLSAQPLNVLVITAE